MAAKRPLSPAQIVMYVLLVLLFAVAVVLGVRVSNLNAQVQYERSLTPTPIPGYGSSMLQVTPDPSLPTPGPLLKTGSSGARVTELQTRLKELGYYTGDVDGRFGEGTEGAVILFQQQHSLTADGKAGDATLAALYAESARPYTAPAEPVFSQTEAPSFTPTATPPESENHQVQARLKELGYYTGNVDGILGPGTKTAVTLFQQQHGLAVDGIAGPATKAVLFSDKAQPRTTPQPGQQPGVSSSGMPLLVNRDHPLPGGYQSVELVTMRTYCDDDIVTIKGSEIQGERLAVDALMTMLRAAHADGLTVWQISAGYRSVQYQQQLFDNQVYAYRQEGLSGSQARAKTRQTVADPGCSEHHLGLAFDVTVPGEQFSNTKQHVWLAQHCWEYGFILRYPADKVDVTGISYEPWHIRYVGVEHALKMRDENLCLEEYIAKYGS